MNTNGNGIASLATIERDRLAELERVIEHGQAVFVAVGDALQEIRDSRLYRETYGTFEDYCRDRWGFSRVNAHRLIQAAEVAEMLPVGNIPATERQARELAPLRGQPDQLRAAWRGAEELASQRGQPMTAALVREVVRDRFRGEAATAVAEMDTAAANLSDATRAALAPEMCRQRGEFKRLTRDLAGLNNGDARAFVDVHRGYIEDFAVGDARRALDWLTRFILAWVEDGDSRGLPG